MELTRIWEVILGRKWVVIQSMIVIGFVSFLVSLFMKDSYPASAKILLMRAEKSVIDIGSVGSQLASIIQTSADVNVNRVLASSGPYIDQMVNRLQLRDDEGNLIQPYEPELSPFKAQFFPTPYITVTQLRDADILVVKANSPDPEEAMLMSNTLAGVTAACRISEEGTDHRSQDGNQVGFGKIDGTTEAERR
jgi:uncharacterized protein involved in exopolysaccharide biosynthesis